MLMIFSVFGDLNFSSPQCYLDELLVFAPSEEEALKQMEMVLSCLRTNNLKLAQKKCHLLRRSVRFLGHVVDGNFSWSTGQIECHLIFQEGGPVEC